MKLKTKFQDEDFELGELADVDIATMPDGSIKVQSIAERGGLHTFFYKTKAEFDANWEDAPEEPKTFWAISWAGEPEEYDVKKTPQELKDMAKAIGNYFSSREKAEKAVEKLKAWQRLKDHNLKLKPGSRIFNNTDKVFTTQAVFLESDTYEYIEQDLDLLFSGGEG